MAREAKPYRLSRAAEADLEDIYASTVRTWSAAQADRYLEGVEDAIHALSIGTREGRPGSELRPDYLILGLGEHFIIFREADEIFIVRILHQSRDLVRHLWAHPP